MFAIAGNRMGSLKAMEDSKPDVISSKFPAADDASESRIRLPTRIPPSTFVAARRNGGFERKVSRNFSPLSKLNSCVVVVTSTSWKPTDKTSSLNVAGLKLRLLSSS